MDTTRSETPRLDINTSPPDYLLILRRDWFRLTCGFMQALEAHHSPPDRERFLAEIDAIVRAFARFEAQVRQITRQEAEVS